MTTISSINSVDRVIRFAAQDAGLLSDGQDPTNEQYVKWSGRLQDVINLEQINGLKLWLMEDLPIPLIAGKQFYIIGPGGDINMPKPMRIVSGYYLDQSNNQRPLTSLSWNEYTGLSNVLTQGAINSYFLNKQAAYFQIAPWLVPDVFTATNGSMHLIIGQSVTQLVTLTDTMNFPQEWFIFLHWALCEAISTGQPQTIMDRASQMAGRYRDALDNFDVEEGSTFMQPDPRQGQFVGRFK